MIIMTVHNWWLVDKTSDKIYDITADQYYHVGQTHSDLSWYKLVGKNPGTDGKKDLTKQIDNGKSSW